MVEGFTLLSPAGLRHHLGDTDGFVDVPENHGAVVLVCDEPHVLLHGVEAKLDACGDLTVPAGGDTEIDDTNDVLLPIAIQTSDALEQAHWIPGQVVVDLQMAFPVKVGTFAAGLGGYHDRALGFEELPLCLALIQAQATVDHRHSLPAFLKVFLKPSLSAAILGKDQDTFALATETVTGSDQVLELLPFAVGGKGSNGIKDLLDGSEFLLTSDRHKLFTKRSFAAERSFSSVLPESRLLIAE